MKRFPAFFLASCLSIGCLACYTHATPSHSLIEQPSKSAIHLRRNLVDGQEFSQIIFSPALHNRDKLFQHADDLIRRALDASKNSPKTARALMSDALRNLFAARLAELGLAMNMQQPLYEICKTMRWEDLDCSRLVNIAQAYDQTALSNYSSIFDKLRRTFSNPHWTTKSRLEITRDCRRNVLKQGAPTFIGEINLNQRHRFEGRYIATSLHPFFHVMRGENSAPPRFEIWTGPEVLVRRCLETLGYQRISDLQVDGLVRLLGARYEDSPVYIITGALEVSWTYKFFLLHRVAQKLTGQSSTIALISPAADTDRFYSMLSDLWYFYAIDAHLDLKPQAIQIGYGNHLGTGRHFFRAALTEAEQHEYPLEKWARLPRGTTLCYRSKSGTDRQLVFASTALADFLAIPMYYVGEAIGRNGVQFLGHWSTAGSLDSKLNLNDIFIPASVGGFDTLFPNEQLSPSQELLLAKAPTGVAGKNYPPNVKLGGRLGSIFNIALEFESVEKIMQDRLRWAAVDTDAFPLFQGFKSTNKEGEIFGQYWITDVSIGQLKGQVQSEANANRDVRAVNLSQKILREFLGAHDLECAGPVSQ